MATIVLGAVGRAFAGPVGGLLGSVAGGFVDRALFSRRGVRDIGRIDNPVVQSAAYGEAIPVIAGRMRAAGNVIWSSGISEQVARSAATSQYSYSASFAVGLAAREILGVRRIWADGRLVRDADGSFLLPMVMRLYLGGEDQPVDPLIAAAEGEAETPAYRGLAYAVFEDLALGDFGNRIPNLTFEIVADEVEADTSLDMGDAVRALLGRVERSHGRLGLDAVGAFPSLSGFFFGQPGSVANALEPLIETIDGALLVTAGGLVLQDVESVAALPVLEIAVGSAQARADGQAGARDRQTYAGDGGPDVVEMGYYDVSRDYQAGLQRVRRGRGDRLRQGVLPAAMLPDVAKSLAARMLARRQAGRLTRMVSLPWRALGVAPGMRVRLDDASDVWRVREVRFERFVLSLALERVTSGGGIVSGGDGGRALQHNDSASGPTVLHLVELPGLGGGVAVAPVVFAAGAGVSAGWRRAGLELSSDMGATYAGAGQLSAPAVMGTVFEALPAGPTGIWDRHNSVEVALLGTHMWLESKSEAAVLQGANLALIGDELIQFAQVEAIGPGRFRLRQLLRAQRGTEGAVAGHGALERFLLLDGPGPVAIDTGIEMIGQTVLGRPAGAFDVGAVPVSLTIEGTALRPLAPVHLRMSREGDDILVRWTRRSRGGFAWLDFVDAPLAEAREAYRIRISLDGVVVRELEASEPLFRYLGADRLADGDGAAMGVEVVQLSEAAGPGAAAVTSFSVV